jgi:hypothetical protein
VRERNSPLHGQPLEPLVGGRYQIQVCSTGVSLTGTSVKYPEIDQRPSNEDGCTGVHIPVLAYMKEKYYVCLTARLVIAPQGAG